MPLTVGPRCQHSLFKSRSAHSPSAVRFHSNGRDQLGRSDRPNGTSISAVHLKIDGSHPLGRSDFEQCVCAVQRHREPSISRSTVHSHALFPAREIQTRRARFNVDRWIQDQRPTFGPSRGRVSPVGLRRPIQDQRPKFVHVIYDFWISRRIKM